MPDVFPRNVRLVLTSALVGILAAGCGFQQQPGSYDDPKARENFVNACTVDTEVIDDARVESPLASNNDCECVFDQIAQTLPFSELEEYEKSVEEDPVPDPPAALTAAIVECTQLGPQAPSGEPSGSTTTTAQP